MGKELRLEIRADFAHASHSIEWRGSPKEEWDITPLQVADASHSPVDAMEGVNGWLFNAGGPAFEDDEDWRLVEVKDEEDDEDDEYGYKYGKC